MQDAFLTPLRVATWLCCLAVALMVMNSKVRYDKGDTNLSLLTSQQLLLHADVDLTEYDHEVGLRQLTGGAYWMYGHDSRNNKITYNYPVGTPLLAIPFVAVGRLLGMDMGLPHHHEQMQRALCVLVSILVLLLLVRIAGHWLSPAEALAAGMLFFCSTTLISTFNGALWSHDTATLFICLAVLELLRPRQREPLPFRPLLLGLWLFMAYLCRPTSMAMVGVVMAWVTWRHTRQSWTAWAMLAGCFGLFVLFSLWQYAHWLPKYYDPSWWKEKEPLFSNIPEYLFSPARGLFTFTPLLLLMFAGYAFRAVRRDLLYTLSLLALAGHLVLLSRHHMWFAGWCYGPRFFSEAMPFAFVALLFGVDAWRKSETGWVRKALHATAAVLLLFGLFVHSWQGLFNTAVYHWDGYAPLVTHEKLSAWNWRFPQFMASEESNQLKKQEADWLLGIDLMRQQVPQGAAILVGEPNPGLFSLSRSWNRHRAKGDGKIYNHMKPLLQEGVKEFYCYLDRLEYLKQFSNVEVEPLVPKVTLGAYLQSHEGDLMLLSVKDEGTVALSEASRAYLRGLGSRVDSLRFRDSYMASIRGGKLQWEEMSHGPLRKEWVEQGIGKLVMASAGKDAGDLSEIQLNGLNLSMQGRGFNVVVLGADGKVRSLANFDTPASDEGKGLIWRCRVK